MTFFQSVRSLRVAALALATIASINSNAIAGPVAKATFEGDYAFAAGYDANGCVWSYVEVSRTGTKTEPQTWLYYGVYDVCAQESIGYGWGTIPNSAFKVSNKGAAVKFTAATTATFRAEGLTGVVAVTLTSSAMYKETYSGHSTATYPDAVFKSHGWWSYSAAQASGTLLNGRIAGAYGGVGEAKQRYMQIERTK